MTLKNKEEKKEDVAAMRARAAASQVQNILKNGTNNNKNAGAEVTPAVTTHTTTTAAVPGGKPQSVPLTPQERERLQNLIIDSEGRTVDKRTGEIVQIQSHTPTLKANLKVAQQQLRQRLADLKGEKQQPFATDLFASGLTSTIVGTGILSTAAGLKSSISHAAAALLPSTSEQAQSEKFFDPRLK